MPDDLVLQELNNIKSEIANAIKDADHIWLLARTGQGWRNLDYREEFDALLRHGSNNNRFLVLDPGSRAFSGLRYEWEPSPESAGKSFVTYRMESMQFLVDLWRECDKCDSIRVLDKSIHFVVLIVNPLQRNRRHEQVMFVEYPILDHGNIESSRNRNKTKLYLKLSPQYYLYEKFYDSFNHLWLGAGRLEGLEWSKVMHFSPHAQAIHRQREALYDVFICYNFQDKHRAEEVVSALTSYGLKVWWDRELIPGESWQEVIERIIDSIPVAVVLIGKNGIGGWQKQEEQALLIERRRRNLPVIPAFLPGSGDPKLLPAFLRNINYVDLDDGLTAQGLDDLVWGIITGIKPGKSYEPERNWLSECKRWMRLLTGKLRIG